MEHPVGRLRPLARRLRSLLPEQVRSGSSDAPVEQADAGVTPLVRNPLVSVVVPVYQVEDYLAECLDSLLQQTYRRLEIVVVDDGSTDGSARIARSYADRDERIVVIRQANAGLGAARNTGLDHCTGDLVTFVDSDDLVPPSAFVRMVRTIEQSGSDFVVGAVTRERRGVSTVKPWVRQAHSRLRMAITIDDAPHMTINNLAPTKLFRRDFLERNELRFPEGTSYEDQVPMTKAYFLARAFDIVPDVVYHWRIRDDRTSISQQKAETRDLIDKLAGQRQVAEFLHERASPAVLHRWYAKTLRHDFLSYLQIAADAEDSYWQVLQDSIASIARQAPKDLDEQVELRVRVAVWLARHGRRDALRQLVGHEDFAASNFPVVERDGRLFADLDFLGEHGEHGTAPPDHLLRIRAVDQQLVCQLEALDWRAPGRLVVRALAAMHYVDPSRHPVTTSYELYGPATLPPITVGTRVLESPAGNLRAKRAHEDHARSTVSGDIDLRALVAADDGKQVTRWELRSVVSAFGVRSESTLAFRRGTGSGVVTRCVLVDGTLVSTRWSDQRGLLVEVHRRYAAVTGAVFREGALEIELRAPGTGPVHDVLVGRTRVPASVLPGPDETTCTLRLPAVPAGETPLVGRLKITGAGSRPVALRVLEGPGP
jgi:CDP-glycerol glycerophosphotransferase